MNRSKVDPSLHVSVRMTGGHDEPAPEPPRVGFVRCASTSGFHRIAFTDWGPVDAKHVVVCVHGLTRQGRDFDHLAARLAGEGMRIICPDLAGRGRSDWLPNSVDYVFPQYCADMVNVMAAVGSDKKISWVGSSLGGLIGLVLAGHPGSSIDRLVLNDVGPQIPLSASSRIGRVLSRLRLDFASVEDAETSMRSTFTAYGPLSNLQWRHLARHSVDWDNRRNRFVLLFDPKILPIFQLLLYYQMTLWSYFDRFDGDVLCVRGTMSDFVGPSLVRDMARRKPGMSVLEVEEVGHMPMLMSRVETDVIASFLRTSVVDRSAGAASERRS